MRESDAPNQVDPLDLLRRFIATPLKAVYRISGIRVMVETNDFSLLPELPLDVTVNLPHQQTLQWKLIRDKDSQCRLEEPMLLTSSGVSVVGMGPGCLFGLDQERRELLGFIGAAIDARTYQEFLVPFFCRMTNEVVYGDANSYLSEESTGSNDA